MVYVVAQPQPVRTLEIEQFANFDINREIEIIHQLADFIVFFVQLALFNIGYPGRI